MSSKVDRAFARKLRKEIEVWEQEGLVSPILKDRILAWYQMKARTQGQGGDMGKFIATLSVLGSVLAGVGVILFVAANWSVLPVWGKLAVIFAPMVASYGAGFALRYERGDFPKVGAALIFLGSLLFGAGIFLVAQIYHLSVHFANGPLVWGLGVLPLAYLLRLQTLLFLSLSVLLVWLGMEVHSWLPHDPSILSASPAEAQFIPLYLMAGLALWGLGLMHRGYESVRKISGPYIVLGILSTLVPGFLFTFDVYGARMGASLLWPFYLGLSGLFLLSLFGLALAGERQPGWVWEVLFLLILLALALYLPLLMSGRPGRGNQDLVLSANLIFALAVLIVLFLGYLRESPVYINLGLFFFVLDVVVRYFDFFWELLPRSLFFIIGGVTLRTGGIFLERKRRKILASFRTQTHED